MAVTVLILRATTAAPKEPRVAAAELCLTLDAPRIVIGRGKSCDIQLPDPSVSLRHASIRQQEGRSVIIDEGSTNGVAVIGTRSGTPVRLTPQTPHPLADGDLVRVGRVWLEVGFAAAVPSSTADARAAAREVMRRSLMDAGEPACASVAVAARTLELGDPAREYVIGRAADCDLVLDDDLASRRHAALYREGSSWKLRDLSSSGGIQLGGEAIAKGGAKLGDGARFTIAGSEISYRDPLERALEEARSAADFKMRAEEHAALPPNHRPPNHGPQPAEPPSVEPTDLEPSEPLDEDDSPGTLDRLAEEPPSVGFAAVDAFVLLIALGLLGISVFGLAYVLG